MSDLRVTCIVGCRPNFIKIVPIMKALNASPGVDVRLVHTGQHYSKGLSDVFFGELQIPQPDVSLEIGPGSHAEQTGAMMIALDKTFRALAPHVVVVVGDVNSTVAAALTAVKLGVPVAHVEAGLRSFDRQMPEEINRLVTDSISDLLFVSEPSGVTNLLAEGKPADSVFFVGNVMIDTLMAHLERIVQSPILAELGLDAGKYAVVTAHRPANVDDPARLKQLVDMLAEVQRHIHLVFPVHPRTTEKMRAAGCWSQVRSLPNVDLVQPLGYLPFMKLLRDARLVLTDSGGVQEETTCLRVPCLTLRDNTERPATIQEGTNELVGTDPARVVATVRRILAHGGRRGRIPEKWDGRAAERVAAILTERGADLRRSYEEVRSRELSGGSAR